MLTIRDAQLQALAGVPRQAFEDQLVMHASAFAPRLHALRGDDTLRAIARTAMTRARAAGFVERGPVRFWVELMFAFGHDWDTDPQLAWARPALADRAAPALQRAHALYMAMSQYVAEVDGPGKCHALAALRRVMAADWDAIVEHGAPGGVPQAMTVLYPEKASRVGTEGLALVATAAERAAAMLELTQTGASALLAGLMFGFGHGVLTDPLYPWVGGTLAASKPEHRARRLAAKTRTYVQAMLGHLAQS
jgi:hypothetical protein